MQERLILLFTNKLTRTPPSVRVHGPNNPTEQSYRVSVLDPRGLEKGGRFSFCVRSYHLVFLLLLLSFYLSSTGVSKIGRAHV